MSQCSRGPESWFWNWKSIIWVDISLYFSTLHCERPCIFVCGFPLSGPSAIDFLRFPQIPSAIDSLSHAFPQTLFTHHRFSQSSPMLSLRGIVPQPLGLLGILCLTNSFPQPVPTEEYGYGYISSLMTNPLINYWL